MDVIPPFQSRARSEISQMWFAFRALFPRPCFVQVKFLTLPGAPGGCVGSVLSCCSCSISLLHSCFVAMICLTESTPGPPDCIKHHPLPNLWSGFIHLSFQSWWLFHNSDLLEKGFSGKRKAGVWKTLATRLNRKSLGI